MVYYLSNGRIAWELPGRVGQRFDTDIYLLPWGWSLLICGQGGLAGRSWRQHQDGYWMHRRVRKKKANMREEQ